MTADDTGRLDFSRRKLLGSVATIGAAGALGGAGSMAFFSDEEEFANNQLTAGELDMKVAYDAYYSDWKANDQGVPEDEGVDVRMWGGAPNTTGGPGDLESGETGLPTNEAWLIAVDDPDQFLENTRYASEGTASCDDGTDAQDLAQPVIDLDDVKPGDFGEVTFDFALCDNPGFVWLGGGLRSASENGYTEPELDDEDEDGPDDEDTVELLDVVKVAVWRDDGNNYQNGEEDPSFVGSLRDVIVGDLGDATPPGVPLDGDIPAEEGGGTGRPCFSAETEHSVAFAWWVPVDHGNEIQTDTASFDLGFYTEQCRHNDGMANNGGGGGQQIECRPGDGFAKLQPELEGATSWNARSIIADNDAGTGSAGLAELDIRDPGDSDLAEAGAEYPDDGTAVPWTLTYSGGTAELTVDGNSVSTAGPEPTTSAVGITVKSSQSGASVGVDDISYNEMDVDCSVSVTGDATAHLVIDGAEFRDGDTLSGTVAYDANGASGEELGFRVDV